MNKILICKCGCGKEIVSPDKRGRQVSYIKGHYWNGKNMPMGFKEKASKLKIKFYKKNGNVIGFKKKNTLWNNQNSKKTQFKKGQYCKEKHPNWNGGSSFYPYSLDWTKTLKRSIRERDNYTCKVCGLYQSNINNKEFDVHHIDYNKQNCDPLNLITLCHSCHTKTNHKRNYWINYFNKNE